jgi:hypothetical protein
MYKEATLAERSAAPAKPMQPELWFKGIGF